MCTLKFFILFTAVTVSTIHADYYGNLYDELEYPIESLRLNHAANPFDSNKDYLNAGLNGLSTLLSMDANMNEEKGRFLGPFEENFRRFVKQVNRPNLGKEEPDLFEKKFGESGKRRYPASTNAIPTVTKERPQNQNLLKKQNRVATPKEIVTMKRICQPRRGHKVPIWCQKCMRTVNDFISGKKEEVRSPGKRFVGAVWNGVENLGRAAQRAGSDVIWDRCRDAINQYLEDRSRDRNNNNNERPRYKSLTDSPLVEN